MIPDMGRLPRLSSGFTLLEIMVVVVLIALTVTIVTVNLERDLDQVANMEARRFASLLEHVRDESIITGQTYAVEVDENENSYRFLLPGDVWTPVLGDDMLRKRYLPEFLTIQFDLTGELEKAQGRRLLIVQGLGEISPFVLTIDGEQSQHLVAPDAAQNISVTQVDREKG